MSDIQCLQWIGQNLNKRQAFYETRGKAYMYDDSAQRYLLVGQDYEEKVSDVSSFITYVKKYLQRNDLDGEDVTIKITPNGAEANLNDARSVESTAQIYYSRVISEPWKAVTSTLKTNMRHKDVIKFLRKNACYIQDFEDTYEGFTEVKMDEKLSVVSTPVVNGRGGYSFQYSRGVDTVENGGFPSEFLITIPYVAGSGSEYELKIDVEADLVEGKNDKKEIMFSFECYRLDSIVEGAKLAEKIDIINALKGDYPGIIVVNSLC